MNDSWGEFSALSPIYIQQGGGIAYNPITIYWEYYSRDLLVKYMIIQFANSTCATINAIEKIFETGKILC